VAAPSGGETGIGPAGALNPSDPCPYTADPARLVPGPFDAIWAADCVPLGATSGFFAKAMLHVSAVICRMG
jgi:hypothetical protein